MHFLHHSFFFASDSKDDGAGEFKGDADADADSNATLPSLAADIAAADGLIASTRAWGAGRRGSLLSAGLLGGAALAPAPSTAAAFPLLFFFAPVQAPRQCVLDRGRRALTK